jgi:micrococcal nuclease
VTVHRRPRLVRHKLPRPVPAAILLVGLVVLLAACAPVPSNDGGGLPAVRPASQQRPDRAARSAPDDPCAPYDAQVWAQVAFDEAPSEHRGLDPDGDGLACEGLPLGAAPALWTGGVPREVEAVSLLDTIDGDTIEVRREGGAVERVRLVGIDTPETGLGSQPLECYGLEASRFAADLLGDAGGVVYLEKDVEERDRYDRLLRWVWFEASGRPYLANEAIVRSGYAERYRDTPNRLHLDRVAAAEAFARAHGYGMWGACG